MAEPEHVYSAEGQIAARTGFAQSTLSNYKRGVNAAQFASTFEKLADGLGMPLPLRQALGLSGDAPAGPRPAAGAMAGIPADMFDLQLLAEAVGRNGAPVRRRDLLALAAQLGATAVLDPDIWERLSHALTRPGTAERDPGPGDGSPVGRVLPAGGDRPGPGRAQGPDRAPAGGQHPARGRPATRTTTCAAA